MRTLQLSPRAQILQICVPCVVISNALYSALSTPKATFWAGQDLSCPDPCTRCSAQGDPALDENGNPRYVAIPALDCATQASIDANFVRERIYWLSYKNIKRACYNVLDKSSPLTPTSRDGIIDGNHQNHGTNDDNIWTPYAHRTPPKWHAILKPLLTHCWNTGGSLHS